MWTVDHHRVGGTQLETDAIVLERAVAAWTGVAVADVGGFGYFLKQLARLACGLRSECEAKCDPGQPRVVGLVVEKPLLASIFNLEKRRKRRKSNNRIYACEMTPSVGNFFKKYSALCIFKRVSLLTPSLMFLRAFLCWRNTWLGEDVLHEGSLLRPKGVD